MFGDGFRYETLPTPRGSVNAVIGGDGPPLLLLHGFPETHLMWHAVAPALMRRFTVVVADLPGYGDSSLIQPAADHAPHSKRALAADLVAAMASLGHERFAVAGHDRGGRVGYRMALDSPETVTRLAVLDIVPTAEVWARADARWALTNWWWPFLAQPAPGPEEMLLAAPHATLYGHHLAMLRDGVPGYSNEILHDYLDRIENPAAVAQMCEDYRAGATIDRALDDADRAAGRTIGCPLLVLWGARAWLPEFYDDVLEVWRPWAGGPLRGAALDATHFVPEDAPAETADALLAFFTGE